MAPADVVASWPARAGDVGAGLPLPAAPLEGVVVLDFGLAIAGPYGAQILADHGATVIKVTSLDFDLTDAIYVGSSHGKLALALDLKHPRGLEIAQRLIATADVVHHNMRTGVAERLQIGYEQARAINPRIIYCHTRGFERNGPRTALPGNDQMGQALTGTEYEAGGTHHGTAPIWGMLGFGDTGNGILSANAVIQALRHRERTGEGQFVHTSILNASLLFNSYTYAHPDGSGPDRRRIDAEQYGFSALQRLYETADGWICVFARDDREWRALAETTSPPSLARRRALRRRGVARRARRRSRRPARPGFPAAPGGGLVRGPRRRRRAVRGGLVDVRPRALRRPRHAPAGVGHRQRARAPRAGRAGRHVVLVLGHRRR